MIGKIHEKQPLCFTSRIGEASGDGVKLEILVVEPTRQPMIVHSDGRAFELPWADILVLAQRAFEEDLIC
jgi:hypothetical protein